MVYSKNNAVCFTSLCFNINPDFRFATSLYFGVNHNFCFVISLHFSVDRNFRFVILHFSDNRAQITICTKNTVMIT